MSVGCPPFESQLGEHLVRILTCKVAISRLAYLFSIIVIRNIEILHNRLNQSVVFIKCINYYCPWKLYVFTPTHVRHSWKNRICPEIIALN